MPLREAHIILKNNFLVCMLSCTISVVLCQSVVLLLIPIFNVKNLRQPSSSPSTHQQKSSTEVDDVAPSCQIGRQVQHQSERSATSVALHHDDRPTNGNPVPVLDPCDAQNKQLIAACVETFFLGIAVATLVCDALYHLIPEAYALNASTEEVPAASGKHGQLVTLDSWQLPTACLFGMAFVCITELVCHYDYNGLFSRICFTDKCQRDRKPRLVVIDHGYNCEANEEPTPDFHLYTTDESPAARSDQHLLPNDSEGDAANCVTTNMRLASDNGTVVIACPCDQSIDREGTELQELNNYAVPTQNKKLLCYYNSLRPSSDFYSANYSSVESPEAVVGTTLCSTRTASRSDVHTIRPFQHAAKETSFSTHDPIGMAAADFESARYSMSTFGAHNRATNHVSSNNQLGPQTSADTLGVTGDLEFGFKRETTCSGNLCGGHHKLTDILKLADDEDLPQKRLIGLDLKTLRATAITNLVSEAIHNFIVSLLQDGLAIGIAFLSGNVAVGAATTIAIFAHEVPSQVADFAILLRGGIPIRFAFFLNAAVAFAMHCGAAVALFGIPKALVAPLQMLGAGNFLCLALALLLPQLQKSAAEGGMFERFTACAGAAIGACLIIFITDSI